MKRNKYPNMKIAILGATGHIAKSIIYYFSKNPDVYLFLFVRNKNKMLSFFKRYIPNFPEKNYSIYTFSNFEKYNYDVIINNIGAGDPKKVHNLGWKLSEITEKYDNKILNYLIQNKNTLYINFSSGAVYGTNIDNNINQNFKRYLDINNLSSKDLYGISKINSEVKHRSLNDYNIVDIRIFSYFSRFIDLKSKFFINDIINAVRKKEIFYTNSIDIIRDYSHPKDLFQLILKCIEQKKINDSFDLFSIKPVKKFDIISFFEKKYNLKYRIIEDTISLNATGIKKNYFSQNYKAKQIGFNPEYTAIQTIQEETKFLL